MSKKYLIGAIFLAFLIFSFVSYVLPSRSDPYGDDFSLRLTPSSLKVKTFESILYQLAIENQEKSKWFHVRLELPTGLSTTFKPKQIFVEEKEVGYIGFSVTPEKKNKIYAFQAIVTSGDGKRRAVSTTLSTKGAVYPSGSKPSHPEPSSELEIVLVIGVSFVILLLILLLAFRPRHKGIEDLKKERNVGELIELLNHPKHFVSAAQALGEIGDKRAASPLIKLLEALPAEELTSDARRAIVRALVSIGGKKADAVLEKLTHDPDQYVRNLALKALGRAKEWTEILNEKNFIPIVTIEYGIPARIYWHPELKVELMITQARSKFLIKGMKKYYIKAVSEEGKETWNRNLGELMRRLKVSFPEFHLYAAGVMNVTEDMLTDNQELKRQEEKVGQSQKWLDKQVQSLDNLDERVSAEEHAASNGGRIASDALRDLAGAAVDRVMPGFGEFVAVGEKREVERLATRNTYETIREMREKLIKETTEQLEERSRVLERMMKERHELVKQFKQKGVGTCYVIGYSTLLRVGEKEDFETMINQTLEDIRVAHTFGGFTQSLERGLKIYHEEVRFPWITHQAEYVGMFCPDQISGFEELKQQILPFFMTTAAEDIEVDGKIKEKGKRTPAKVFQAFIDKVETVSHKMVQTEEFPLRGGWIGNVMRGKGVTETPFFFPLDELSHGYVSGTTGSGKTFLARVLVENAIIEGVNVIILDNTRQWTGLLKSYEGKWSLGAEHTYRMGFAAEVYVPDEKCRINLPADLKSLMKDYSIISLKGLSDLQRCQIARDVLQLAYESMGEESKLKSLIVIEEAHTFLPDNVSPDAKDIAKEVRNLIDRIAREARKYGLNLLLVTQSLSDFRNESRIVREMCNTKFFLRATDRTETSWIEDYISKEAAETVKQLQPGEVLISNPFFGPVKVKVRAPFSKIGELKDKEIEEAVRSFKSKSDFISQFWSKARGDSRLTEKEKKVIEIAKDYVEKNGEPIHVSKLQEVMRILSKKEMQKLVDDMEKKGLIKTERIQKKGRPRVIIPV